jgi:hypothetical protein
MTFVLVAFMPVLGVRLVLRVVDLGHDVTIYPWGVYTNAVRYP